MKTLNRNISIEEFEGKTFKIEFFEAENSAFVTHYLHNYRNGIKNSTKKHSYYPEIENLKIVA